MAGLLWSMNSAGPPHCAGPDGARPAPQVGCAKGGAWYEDYAYIGGQHRYAVDQYGGGRGDPHARASARLWYTANVAAAGLPMVFMGTEFAQSGWWCVGRPHGRLCHVG